MTWLIILAVIILICLIPLGVRAVYNSDGFRLWLLIGPVKIFLLPKKKKKEEKQDEKPKKAAKPQAKKAQPKEEKKEGGSLLDFLPLLDVAKGLIGSFFRKIRIRRLEVKLTLAGDDPCDLAVNYGKTWAATGGIIPILEELFVIKKRDVQINCDFTAQETKIYAAADITILIGRLLGLVGKYGYLGLREFLKIRKKRKGEQNNESKSS